MVYACKQSQSLSERELEAVARIKRARRRTTLFEVARNFNNELQH